MFEAMVEHLRSIDSIEQTVVAIQIQNEPCVHKIERCHCPVCDSLETQSRYSDEKFYAWSIARYIDTLARVGKTIYAIPYNINAILHTGSTYRANAHKYRKLYMSTASHVDFNGPDAYAASMSSLRTN